MTKDEYFFFEPQLNEIVKIVKAYPISMEEIVRIVRIAAIMTAERSPGYVEKVLSNNYKEYHYMGGGL